MQIVRKTMCIIINKEFRKPLFILGLQRTYYCSKVLLYGEYTVTTGSGAIATPYPSLCGHWDEIHNFPEPSAGLILLYQYLIDHQDLSAIYDLAKFKKDIDNGLVFQSNIPNGYGLGSSGALVAAFYDRYCILKSNDLETLKKVLGATESAFHGASSGLDPLVSYIKDNILIKDNGTVETTALDSSKLGFFLIDTGISRQTEYFVEIFKNKLQNSVEFNTVVKSLALKNKEAIDALLIRNKEALWEATKKISKIQFEYFREMIPDAFMDKWSLGLATGKYCLKLCGAGGGGMLMGLLADTQDDWDFGPDMKVILL